MFFRIIPFKCRQSGAVKNKKNGFKKIKKTTGTEKTFQ